MKLYEQLKKQAMKDGEAVRYYAFCMHDHDMPEDLHLYKAGFERMHGFEITMEQLEKILEKKTK